MERPHLFDQCKMKVRGLLLMLAACVLNIYLMEHSAGTVVLLFHALENDLDNVLIYALEIFLNYDPIATQLLSLLWTRSLRNWPTSLQGPGGPVINGCAFHSPRTPVRGPLEQCSGRVRGQGPSLMKSEAIYSANH